MSLDGVQARAVEVEANAVVDGTHRKTTTKQSTESNSMPKQKKSACSKSFLAIITPVGAPAGGPPADLPDHIWGGGNEPFPTPPIVVVPPTKPDEPPIFIWGGGNEPFPTPPIVIIPGDPPLAIWGPPDMPPGFWGGATGPGVKPQPPTSQPPSGAPPHPAHPIVNVPAHPIVIPPPPEPFPEPPAEVIKPSPDEGGWGYANPPGAWFYVPPQSSAQPKTK